MQGSLNIDKANRKMAKATMAAGREVEALDRLTRKLDRRTARRLAAAERIMAERLHQSEQEVE